LLNECGYLFGKFGEPTEAEAELINKNIQDYLSSADLPFRHFAIGFDSENERDLRRREYRSWRGPLAKKEFEDLMPEVQLKWALYVKANYPRTPTSKRYDFAERLYENSPTELPELTRQSWLRKLVAIFR
jgi:hypothetical protein